jgi:hypothetical protein
MGHLDKYVRVQVVFRYAIADDPCRNRIRRSEHINHMGAGNLAVVMGPTLLGAPPSMGALNLQHMAYQCKVGIQYLSAHFSTLLTEVSPLKPQAIETILERYREIFVEESEE